MLLHNRERKYDTHLHRMMRAEKGRTSEAQKRLALMDSVEATHLMTRGGVQNSGIYVLGIRFTMMVVAVFATIMAELPSSSC